MRTAIATFIGVAFLSFGAANVAAAPQVKTKICGQIKHGPSARYTSLVTHKKLSGTTWTVFSTGVSCSSAMGASPKILKWWAHAKIDASAQIGMFSCTKESDGHGSAGTAGCKAPHGLDNIELIMTGNLTVAQLKKMFFIGP
jgi:hypothetical protein